MLNYNHGPIGLPVGDPNCLAWRALDKTFTRFFLTTASEIWLKRQANQRFIT